MPSKISAEDHKKKHQALHASLDELAADFFSHTKNLPSKTSILDLMEWSHAQTISPTPDASTEDDSPTTPGKIDPKRVVRDCVAACPELAGVSNLPDIITAVIGGAGETLREIEKEINEAGSMTANTAAVLMGVGAVFEVAKQLPATRGKLVEAGRVVGRMMSKRFQVKIAAAIAAKDGGN